MSTPHPLASITHSNLNSTVYETLRQALLSGNFRPNDKLRIRDLAAQLGTSVTPVRDAILMLAKEQVLEMRSPKDIRVPLLTREKYLEIRAIRLELEGLAAYVAAEKITNEQLEELRLSIEENTSSLANNQLALARKQNQAFHFQVIRIADMPVLESILDRLWMQTAPLIAMAYTTAYTDDIRISHHHEILDFLSQKNGELAKRAIQEDIIGGSQKILDLIDELSEKNAE